MKAIENCKNATTSHFFSDVTLFEILLFHSTISIVSCQPAPPLIPNKLVHRHFVLFERNAIFDRQSFESIRSTNQRCWLGTISIQHKKPSPFKSHPYKTAIPAKIVLLRVHAAFLTVTHILRWIKYGRVIILYLFEINDTARIVSTYEPGAGLQTIQHMYVHAFTASVCASRSIYSATILFLRYSVDETMAQSNARTNIINSSECATRVFGVH